MSDVALLTCPAGKTLYNNAVAAGKVGKAAQADVANLKQWEWGLPDTAVTNIRNIWASLGKPAANLKVISSGVVEGLFVWTPEVWQQYLAANSVPVRGFHWNSYWVAHTQLERAAGVVPFPSYAYFHPDWHPIHDKAVQVLNSMQASLGTSDLSSLAPNSRAFVNNIGSSSDITATRDVMTAYGLTAANGAHFGSGIDCVDSAAWDGWPGSGTQVPPAFQVAAVAVQNATLAPYASKTDWVPISFASLASLPSVCYR